MIPLDVRIIGNLSPPDWWTIGLTATATFFGAIVGAGIAYVIARQTAQENRRALVTARRNDEEAATLRAVVKVMELLNAIAGYHGQIEKSIGSGKKKIGRDDLKTWLVMLPVIGKPQEIHIAADELIAFTRARRFDFITDLLYLVSQYNSMIYGVEAYSNRRDALMEYITPETMNGLVGKIAMPDNLFRQLAPRIAAVSDLAEQVREEVRIIYESSFKVVDAFGPIVRQYFNDPTFPIPGRIST